MKNGLLLLMILISSISCTKSNKQENKKVSLDSLSIYIAGAGNDTLPSLQRENYNRKAHSILLDFYQNDSTYRKNLLKVAAQFYTLKKYSEFKNTTKLSIEKASEAKDTVHLIKSFSFLAKYAADNSLNDSAYYFYSRAEKLALKMKDDKILADIYLKKAFIQLYSNDYSGCELSASKALNYLKTIDDKDKSYDAYNLIGITSNEMKSYDRAIEYHNRALRIINDNGLNDQYHLASSSLNNLGVVYQNMDMHLKAIENFKKALEDKNLFRDSPGLYAILIDNLAYSKFKSKNFIGLPNLFYQSLKIRDSLKLTSGIVINKIHLSEYYDYKKDTVNSLKFAKEALSLSRKSRIPGDMLGSLNQISSVDYKNSAAYSKEYIKISDSIQQAERQIRDRFERIQFETAEITLEKDKLAEQNRNLLYFFVGTLMIGLLLFVIRTQRARNRELLLKQAQQKANEDIYNLMITQQNKIEESRIKEKKRIAQELHDGVLGRLFGARLNLDSLNRMTDEEAVAKRNNYLSELKNIEQDIREISHDLNREKYVLINNFVAILNNLLEEQKNSFGAEVIVTIDEKIKWEALSNTLKINLYRIIQESLQNINKYAQANTIRLDIKKISDNLIVTIIDDGIGFAVNSKKKGIGLQNMLSRANDLDGIFDIRSKKGKGTTITVTFPIGNKQVISTEE